MLNSFTISKGLKLNILALGLNITLIITIFYAIPYHNCSSKVEVDHL